MALDAPATPSPQPPRRQSRQKCRCCTLLHHKALNEALRDPLQTLRAIAGRFGVSLHSLAQHRRVCLGLPPFGKKEGGQRRQLLRRIAPEQSQPFAVCAQQELGKIQQACVTLAGRITTLQAQHALLERQAQALEDYLRLSAKKEA